MSRDECNSESDESDDEIIEPVETKKDDEFEGFLCSILLFRLTEVSSSCQSTAFLLRAG